MADAGVLQLNYAGYIWVRSRQHLLFGTGKAAARQQYIVSVARECAELGF